MSDRVSLDVASLSHPGMVRTHNEDSVFVDGEAGLAVLADGMGGYSAGEVASGIAVNGAGMGTTLVATVFFQNRVSIGHIGDSRCYRLRADRFEQLTHDHSLLQEQIDSGMLTQEQAKYSLNKNLVTRALGIEAVVPADIAEYRVEAEDVYVLCSDGLTDMVDAEVVREIVAAKRSDLAEAAAELIDVANQNGGRDNVSVVVIRVPAEFLPTGGWLQRWMTKKPA
ncbi:MAG: serine/threonine-protein phosphatase [Betaproteobacteria bacterium]|nr:MAG: serine/threonine-protein phosphatase [Betaproteobacteria bacterium]